jgi:hypothetical protein
MLQDIAITIHSSSKFVDQVKPHVHSAPTDDHTVPTRGATKVEDLRGAIVEVDWTDLTVSGDGLEDHQRDPSAHTTRGDMTEDGIDGRARRAMLADELDVFLIGSVSLAHR